MRIVPLALSSFLIAVGTTTTTTTFSGVDAFAVVNTKSTNTARQRRQQQQRQLLLLHSYQPVKEESDFDFTDPLRPIVFGQRLLIPFTPATFDFGNDFQNEGPFSWLIPYSSLMGYQPGKTLVGGLSTTPTTRTTTTIDAEEDNEELLRQQAASSLMNISEKERNTRIQYGNYMYGAAALYATYSTIVLDDGLSIAGNLLRFVGLFPLLLLGRGYQLSGTLGV